jgi:hypothetical protein
VPDEQVAAALADQALHSSWLLAAEDGTLTFPQFATPLLVATVAAVRDRRPWSWAKSRRRLSIC